MRRTLIGIAFMLIILSFACKCEITEERRGELVSPEEIIQNVHENPVKVLFIGIDGADWDIILPMINDGELPNLEKLMRQGSYGILNSIEPMQSPLLWTTMVTGKLPPDHGIEDYVVKLPDQPEPVPIGSGQRKVKALWNILSEYGETVAFMDWWASYPAEEVNGFIISDRYDSGEEDALYPPQSAEELAPYLEITEEMLDELQTRFTSFPYDPDFGSYPVVSDYHQNNRRIATLRWHLKRDLAMVNAACYLMENYQPDLVGIYLKGTDGVAHVVWKYYQPTSLITLFEVSEEEREYFAEILPEYYRWVDEQVGRLLEAAGGRYTVLVASDHGFEAKVEEINYVVKFLLADLGYLALENNQEDWSKTQAYVFHPDWSNRRDIYLNLKGREEDGIVDPADAPTLQKEIASALAEIKTTDGIPLFEKVEEHKLSEKAEEGATPDIQVWVNPEIEPWDILLVEGSEYPASNILLPRGLSGDHRKEGVFILAGAGIKRAFPMEPAELTQITPTILTLMGYPVACDMVASPIEGALTPEFLEQFPLTEIATYEGTTPPSTTLPSATASDEEMIEQLRGLGYIQ